MFGLSISASRAITAVNVCVFFATVSVMNSSNETVINQARMLSTARAMITTSDDTTMMAQPDSLMMKGESQKWKDEEAKGNPVVAWLLSFPNSGTTYTQQVYQAISDGTTAGNYGYGCTISKETGAIVPLHENDNRGPFIHWIRRKVPKPYVLTKTHCGGFCFECPPDEYIETDRSFLLKCASGLRLSTDDDGNQKSSYVRYPPSKVRRVIHLIRDPFDNVVARMRYLHTTKDQDWLDKYPKTRQGFRDYCNNWFGPKYAEKEFRNRFIDKAIYDLARQVPCGIDFFRYIQWHNRAFETTHALQFNEVPTLLMNYEKYETDYDGAVEDMQEFLQIPKLDKVTMPPFSKGHSYHDYFTPEEIEAATALMREIASPITWKYIQHYMKPALDGARKGADNEANM